MSTGRAVATSNAGEAVESNELCKFLDWDSAFFARRIGRIVPTTLSPEAMAAALAWCYDNRIECLYFLTDAADGASVAVAEDSRFRLVDIRITLQRNTDRRIKTTPNAFPGAIRSATPDDIPFLRAIAENSHHGSRFYYDRNFPVATVDSLYARWIEQSCTGYADVVFVAVVDDVPAGYLSCHLRETGEIGLVGVDSRFQGIGIGGALVEQALDWFAERGVADVKLVTQGRNERAQRLYQRMGFVTASCQLWYHRWFSQ